MKCIPKILRELYKVRKLDNQNDTYIHVQEDTRFLIFPCLQNYY